VVERPVDLLLEDPVEVVRFRIIRPRVHRPGDGDLQRVVVA